MYLVLLTHSRCVAYLRLTAFYNHPKGLSTLFSQISDYFRESRTFQLFFCDFCFIMAKTDKGQVLTMTGIDIGKRIKAKRKELRLSAEELGKRIGKDRSTIYRYERGDIESLPLEILKPLAEALETTTSYLTGWEKEVPTERAAFDLAIAKDEELRGMLKMFMALPEDKKKTVKQMIEDYYNAFA